jgi:hypothetical protein
MKVNVFFAAVATTILVATPALSAARHNVIHNREMVTGQRSAGAVGHNVTAKRYKSLHIKRGSAWNRAMQGYAYEPRPKRTNDKPKFTNDPTMYLIQHDLPVKDHTAP